MQLLNRGAIFAALVSAGPIAVLGHGLAGTGSIFTGLITAGSTAALLLLARKWPIKIDSCDVLFGLFILGVAISLAMNPVVGGRKEIYLLAMSLSCYPALRLSGAHLLTSGFMLVTALVVGLGTLATVVALLAQWDNPHGKPFVFGEFDAAPAQFAASLTILAIAVACTSSSWKRSLLLSAFLAIPTAIFAASMVRFTLLAMTISLAVAAALSPSRTRMQVLTITGALLLSVGIGVAARWNTAMIFATRTGTAFNIDIYDREAPMIRLSTDSACPRVEVNNSVAIRKQLYADAFRLLPQVGAFGLGLDGFSEKACIMGMPPHNSLVQATIEFGWIAGASIVTLMILLLNKTAVSIAKINSETRFVICSLVFSILMALAHGRISRDFSLFAFAGYAASLRFRYASIAKDWMLTKVTSPTPA